MGDVDFVNDFAEQLFEALNNLSTFCDHVMEDCKARKERLTHALIWDEIGAGGEELVQLSASEESTLMKHFYTDLGNECEAWYNMMSNKYASDAELFLPNVESLGDQKYLMMNYANEEFHAIKDDMFTIVDGLRDAQRVIESTQNYFESRALKMMNKRIDDTQWKFQLKYSTKMTKRCAYDHQKVTKFADDLDASAVDISGAMKNSLTTFAKESTKDWKSWDCKAMYPQPKKADLGIPNWLGGLTSAAKTGFEVYNTVKSLIPGGTKAGAGPIPGSDAASSSEELELYEMIGFAEVEGLGKKISDGLKKNSSDKEEAWAQRLLIWKNALAMCEEDKQTFLENINNTKDTIRQMAEPIEWTEYKPFPETLDAALDQYNTDVGALEMGDMTAAEAVQNKAMLMNLETAVKGGLENAQKHGEDAMKLKDVLIK